MFDVPSLQSGDILKHGVIEISNTSGYQPIMVKKKEMQYEWIAANKTD